MLGRCDVVVGAGNTGLCWNVAYLFILIESLSTRYLRVAHRRQAGHLQVAKDLILAEH